MRQEAGVAYVSVAGEIDMATVDRLDAAFAVALAGPPPVRMVVDFAEVTFCDSSGLASLDRAYAAACTRDIDFRLVGVQPAVRRVLEVAGMTSLTAE